MVRLFLYRDEVRQLHYWRNLAKAYTLTFLELGFGRLCGMHQALPPSYSHIHGIMPQASNIEKDTNTVKLSA